MTTEPEQRFDDVGDIFERLHQDGRLHPVSNDVLECNSMDAIREARRLVETCIHERWATANDLARRTGLKASAISAFRNDKWKGRAATLATVASTLAKAVSQIMRERQAEENAVGGFVSTRAAEQIYAIVQYALRRKRIAVFLMPAGMGKTMALDSLQIETPGAVLLTTTRRRSTVKSFLELWCRALGLNEVGRAEDLQDRIVGCLRNSSRLTLIDEAHKLPIPVLDVIREIYDAASVPIVMAATPSFYQTITSRRVGTQACELMDQFYSRVGMFRDLTTLENPGTGESERLVTREDIAKVFARGKVRIARDGLDFLCALANTPGAGGLRVCRDLVQLVIDLYPEEQITAQRLRSAMVTRVGTREAGFRIDQALATDDEPAVAAVAV